MCSLFRLILSLWFVSTGATLLCSSWREFPVDNCTACPVIDQTTTRGNVTMAVCEERAAGKAGGMAYACVCVDFPAYGLVSDLRFHPHKNGNMTRCEFAWTTVPGVVWGCSLLTVGVLLYVAAHLLYIASISGICCFARHACTKTNGAALSLGVSTLFWLTRPAWDIVSQGRLPINQGVSVTTLVAIFFLCISLALFYPSIADVAYPEEDEANQRCCANVSFWCLAGGTMASNLVSAVVPLIHEDAAQFGQFAEQFGFVLIAVQLIYSIIFTVIAHKKMRKVSLHPHYHK